MEKNFMFGLVAVLLLGLVFVSGCSNFKAGIDGTNNTSNVSLNSSENGSSVSKKEVKRYLVKKYKPGTCFGMPESVSKREMKTSIKNSSELSDFIKENFKVSADKEVYEKIKQFENINLSRARDSYKFIFKDGDCCNIVTYKGVVDIGGDKRMKDRVVKKDSKKVPC